MNDPKFGYSWLWLLPYYYIYQVYLLILEKWFPKKYKKALGVEE